jgi:hypothetical protein
MALGANLDGAIGGNGGEHDVGNIAILERV